LQQELDIADHRPVVAAPLLTLALMFLGTARMRHRFLSRTEPRLPSKTVIVMPPLLPGKGARGTPGRKKFRRRRFGPSFTVAATQEKLNEVQRPEVGEQGTWCVATRVPALGRERDGP